MKNAMTLVMVAAFLSGAGACATRPPTSVPVVTPPVSGACPVDFRFRVPAGAGRPLEMVAPSPQYRRGTAEWARERTVTPGCVPRFHVAFAQGAQDGRVFVVFHHDTPFVDANGREVWTFDIADSSRLSVRSAGDGKCTLRDPCKYSVVHTATTGPSQYPPYDPWIIIHTAR